MTCPHLYDGYGLPCQRTDEHDPDARAGHVYDAGDVPSGPKEDS